VCNFATKAAAVDYLKTLPMRRSLPTGIIS
jgi:hypothetical protein